MYVTRDKDGDLCLFNARPVKIDECGYWQPAKTMRDLDLINRYDKHVVPGLDKFNKLWVVANIYDHPELIKEE